MPESVDFLALVPNASKLDEAHDQRVAEFEADQETLRERERVDALRRHLVECGCPIKDLTRVLEKRTSETEAMLTARGAIMNREGIVVLSGLPGCGKTTAAAWWLLQPRERVPYVGTSSARFIDATGLARWPKYDNAEMLKLTRSRALVIDDLGVEYADKKGAYSSLLDEVINSRYSAELPTVITTNLPGAEFKARYGERIADRIREAGRFVELGGESLRGKR